MPKTSTDAQFDVILQEHRALRESVTELRRFLRQPCPPPEQPAASAWAGALADRLVDFRERARRHFQSEESSGFMDQLGRSTPRATRTIARMLGEHDRILTDLRAVLDATTAYARHQPPEHDLRSAVAAVLDRFEQHESDENDLIQDLVCDDLGAGD